nr:MAG TPA: hypothetical protein [Caudoviricetes sp.]
MLIFIANLNYYSYSLLFYPAFNNTLTQKVSKPIFRPTNLLC